LSTLSKGTDETHDNEEGTIKKKKKKKKKKKIKKKKKRITKQK